MLERQSAPRAVSPALDQSARLRQCDRRARLAAQATLAASAAERVIRFGSRARGDYAPQPSDIAIMLLPGEEPQAADQEAVKAAAQNAAPRNAPARQNPPGPPPQSPVRPATGRRPAAGTADAALNPARLPTIQQRTAL